MIHFSRWCGGIHRAMLMFLHFPFMRKKGGGGAKKILKLDTIMQFPLHSSLGSIVGGHDIPPLSLFRCICKWDQTPPNLLSFNTTSLTQNTNTESNNNSKERKLKKKKKKRLKHGYIYLQIPQHYLDKPNNSSKHLWTTIPS